MTKILEENGKVYTVDEETGLVIEAKTAPEDEFPLRLNERVEVDGSLGKVISKSSSVYGEVVGVRFDTGETGEFLTNQVNRSVEEPIRYDTPIDQVKADWERYQELPSYTLEQVEAKARLARALNVTAKALVTDRRTSLSDAVLLDTVVITTGTDLIDIQEQTERLSVGENYGESFPQYSIPTEVVTTSDYSREDASWLSLSADDALTEQDEFDWDSHLTSEALKATSSLTEEQLQSDDFMEAVEDFRSERMPVGYEPHRAQFHELLQSAREEALGQRQSARVAKTAQVETELEDFREEQLYL